jgi:hypothetical protein
MDERGEGDLGESSPLEPTLLNLKEGSVAARILEIGCAISARRRNDNCVIASAEREKAAAVGEKVCQEA